MKTIIIGNGVAGLAAAQELRALDAQLEIEMFSSESYLDYPRPRLPEFIAGTLTEEKLFLHKKEWYDSRQFTLHSNAVVRSINPQKKALLATIDENTSEVVYDTLILATGALPNSIKAEGSGLPHVFSCRTLDDSKHIIAHTKKNSESAVVIGGGLLGLEIASALKEEGVKNVYVLEFFERLLPRQLDIAASKLLQNQLEERGLTIVTSASVIEVTPEELVLEDGKRISAQTVVQSLGVTPTTSLAKECGIEVKRGIVVNEKMQTSEETIFACGDCAEFEGASFGIVPVALEQGKVAARFAHAQMIPSFADYKSYTQIVPQTMLKVAGIEAVSFGKAILSDEELTSNNYVEHTAQSEGRYEKLVVDVRDGKNILVGALLYGSKKNMSKITPVLNKSITHEQIKEILDN